MSSVHRYAVRLSTQPPHEAILVEGAESDIDAAVAFAECAAIEAGTAEIVVTDLETDASVRLALELDAMRADRAGTRGRGALAAA